MMHKRPQSRVVAKQYDLETARLKYWVLGSVIGVAALWAGSQAFGEAHDVVIESHGFNEYGALKYGPDATALEYVNPDAPLGGEISLSTTGTFDSMNPFATLSGSPGALSSSIFERLMDVTSDEVGSYYCVLCTTIEYPEDRSYVIFNLRDDVFFSDGTPMTAADVVFTHELLREQATPSYASYIRDLVPSYEAIDDYTVRFDFNPDFPLRGRITQMGASLVMSKAWFEANDARLDEARLEVSPGTAEYMIDVVDPGRQIIYTRNPDYWGADHPMRVGRGNYDSIRIEYFADSDAGFEAFKAGDFTFRRETSSINWATSYDFPAIEEQQVVKDELADGTLPVASGFVFNLRREKLQDRNVRRALGLMYNFNWTNENLQYGLFQQREAFWENDRLKATGLPQGRELEILETVRDKLPEAIFTEDALLPHESGDRPIDRGNLREALALMEEAGFTSGDDGLLRDADGNTLDIEFLETRQSFDRIINPYIENLQRLGVNITYNRVDPSQFQARTQANDFDMVFDSYRNGLQEGSGLGQRYGCEDRDDVFNPAGFCSEAVDAIVELVRVAENYDDMAAGVRAVDRIMRYEYFMVPTWYNPTNWVAYYDFYEYPENLPEFGLGHLDYWWINAENSTR